MRYDSSMRRVAVKLLVFLLLGAVVNVAVAAVFMELRPESKHTRGNDFPSKEYQYATVLYVFPDTPITALSCQKFESDGWDVTITTSMFLNGDTPLERMVKVEHLKTGWPFRTFQGWLGSEWNRNRADLEFHQRWVLASGEWGHDSFILEGSNLVYPLQPILSGFLFNMICYAGSLWLLFATPFALLRQKRVRKGLCPKCAYPVGGSTVCTECGKPVQRRAKIEA